MEEPRMHGIFTDADTGRLTYALSLSDSCLTVQRVSSPPSQTPAPEHLDLRDCLGSRAHRGEREDRDAYYLCVYFYPYRRRWMAWGPVRQRDERRFRLVLNSDDNNDDEQEEEDEEEDAKLREAERWARAIRNRPGNTRGVLFSEVRRACGVMVLVNPQSGRGQAMAQYNGHVQRMLTEADIPHTLVITERQNHARDLVRSTDLSQWDALIILSGDGLLFEVVNGLMERPDWEKAIQTPLGILPGGSGNALAASVHHYTRASPVWGEDLLTSCGFLLCKGLVSGLDLISVQLSSGARLFSFLSLAWGFVADVDIESETFRQIGALRFILGTLVRLASLRIYQGKLAYLPAGETDSVSSTGENLLNDHLMAPFGQPVPQNWTLVEEREFVLVLAMFQSHLSEDLMAAPGARADDGIIHLFYLTAGVSRATLLRLFRAMQSGTHLDCGCAHLVYVRAQAIRLEPLSADGVLTVDGERVHYGPVQAQVHRAAARIIC
ncbi:sphingosine kinase 1 [Danio rerio]|uniref:Sphingosine kinase 1 n=1 Tax=Danio rerio TaxID=7955 RepID=A0AC58J0Y7_DANRE|nr:sphingosine kinase 1 [Danio rerio]|eukprot:XP_002667585.3 sphingosine kinase 1 [Danio rerio]